MPSSHPLHSTRRLLILPICMMLMGASMFSQTSADPATRTIRLKLKDETLKVNLEGAGVQVQLFPNGGLKRLEFQQVGHFYDVRFHDLGIPGDEVVAEVKRFQLIDNQHLLDGPSQTFGVDGGLLTETHWEKGTLHGPQRFFNQYHQLIQERFYSHNHPVGHWKIFYGDGTLAADIAFPTSEQDWRSTHRGLGKAKTLHQMKPGQTLAAVETWYNQNGIKQKEREYRLFKRGEAILVEATGVTRSFDHQGGVIRETNLWQGSGEEVRHFANEEAQYTQRIVWINGGMFRDEWVRVPN